MLTRVSVIKPAKTRNEDLHLLYYYHALLSLEAALSSERFAMELFSAILGDLANRSISYIVDKYWKQTSIDENVETLHRLLLRTHTIVEEAEGRHVTNQGMLQQLKIMREELFKGYYVLDAFRYRALREKDEDEEVRHSFALSRFNPAKRIRFSTSNTQIVTFGSESVQDLEPMIHSLEKVIADTKEFIVFLMSCPPMYRQPYSTHFFLDKCMFSRQIERERVIDFLLLMEPPGTNDIGVLPIIGPALIGKSTLIEHVCSDERVRNHFSLILFYNGGDLKDETVATLRDRCVIKHQNRTSQERLLVIIELLGDVDEETWKELYFSEGRMPQGSKIIITSRSEKIVRFGTTRSLRLKCLPREAYWYFFKVFVFGSTDPKEHPKLASIAMEIATELRGSLLCAYVVGALLRVHFDAQFWYRVLACTREYMQKNLLLIGEYPHDLTMKNHPRYAWRIGEPKPVKYVLLYDSYQKGYDHVDVPKITVQDLLFGDATARGKFDILLWKSQMPPYCNYICSCVI